MESNSHDLSILQLSGYYEKHFKLSQTMSGYDAWEILESEYYAICKKNRYSSYESFRTMKSQFYKNVRL